MKELKQQVLQLHEYMKVYDNQRHDLYREPHLTRITDNCVRAVVE